MLPGPLQGHPENSLKGIYGITTVYNEEATLPGVLKSVIGWWAGGVYGKNLLRWIFVDDGSTDNSLKILREFAAQYPVIHCIKLQENKGKGWAYHEAAQWIISNDASIDEKIIFQMDSDLMGVRAVDIDGLLTSLIQEQHIGLYKGTRVASLALVPSPHKEGLRKWARERLGAFTARGRMAITGQRAYYGSTLVEVTPHIEEETRFGLEAMLNVEIVERSKKIQKHYNLTERQRRGLVSLVRWRHITHVPYKEKMALNNGADNRARAWIKAVPHYVRMGYDTVAGAVRGDFGY